MTLEAIPPDLPIPGDDGAADHLPGHQLPDLEVPTAQGGTVNLSRMGKPWLVLYVYPMTGRPDVALPQDWDLIPGARGCTPQTCGFRDHQADLSELGAEVVGMSTQSVEYQAEMVGRLHVPFPIVSDESGLVGEALALPRFEVEGMTLYKRITLVAQEGKIEAVMYPVFPPNRNAADVMDWLGAQPG